MAGLLVRLEEDACVQRPTAWPHTQGRTQVNGSIVLSFEFAARNHRHRIEISPRASRASHDSTFATRARATRFARVRPANTFASGRLLSLAPSATKSEKGLVTQIAHKSGTAVAFASWDTVDLLLGSALREDLAEFLTRTSVAFV